MHIAMFKRLYLFFYWNNFTLKYYNHLIIYFIDFFLKLFQQPEVFDLYPPSIDTYIINYIFMNNNIILNYFHLTLRMSKPTLLFLFHIILNCLKYYLRPFYYF